MRPDSHRTPRSYVPPPRHRFRGLAAASGADGRREGECLCDSQPDPFGTSAVAQRQADFTVGVLEPSHAGHAVAVDVRVGPELTNDGVVFLASLAGRAHPEAFVLLEVIHRPEADLMRLAVPLGSTTRIRCTRSKGIASASVSMPAAFFCIKAMARSGSASKTKRAAMAV